MTTTMFARRLFFSFVIVDACVGPVLRIISVCKKIWKCEFLTFCLEKLRLPVRKIIKITCGEDNQKIRAAANGRYFLQWNKITFCCD